MPQLLEVVVIHDVIAPKANGMNTNVGSRLYWLI